MYDHVKTGCKHIPPSEQPLQFQSGYYLNKPHSLHAVQSSAKTALPQESACKMCLL